MGIVERYNVCFLVCRRTGREMHMEKYRRIKMVVKRVVQETKNRAPEEKIIEEGK